MEKDIVSKDIFKDKERLADVFNNALFKADIVKPENLKIVDTAEVYTDEKTVQGRFRDVIMELTDKECSLAVLGIENQTKVDNLMPLRVMNYDNLCYFEQVRELKNKTLPRGDKLRPVITLVLYYGATMWNGPKSLYDILNVEDKVLKQFIPNYPLNVVSICGLSDEEIESYDTDIKLFFGVVKTSNNGKEFVDFCNKHSEDFKNMRADMKNAVKYFCSSEEYDEILQKCETEGGIDMCIAFKEIAEEAKSEGRAEGRNEGRTQGRSEERAEFIKTMRTLGYSEEEIEKILINMPK